MSAALSSPHRDCAVQTTSSPRTAFTLVTDDPPDVDNDDDDHADCTCAGIDGGTVTPYRCTHCSRYNSTQADTCTHDHDHDHDHQISPTKTSAAQRHFAKYEPQQLQEMSDEIELGWDCGICLETAEDPCVTRCGHLYCQSHLNHWLSTHPSCPVCKTHCTPTHDVVPIFSRGRTSPAPSSLPSSPSSSTPSSLDRAAYACYDDAPLAAAPAAAPAAPLTPQSRSDDLCQRWPEMPHSECVMSDYDIMPPFDDDNIRILTIPQPVPPVPPAPSHSGVQPHPHPLMTSYIIAHYLGIALRILGVGILLGVLLR